jgi:hypothetical protein
MQQIFQSRQVSYRLHGIKRILAEAVDELSSLIIDDGVMTAKAVREVITKSTSPNDDDSDLIPPEGYHDVTLDDEFGYHLANDAFDERANWNENNYYCNNEDEEDELGLLLSHKHPSKNTDISYIPRRPTEDGKLGGTESSENPDPWSDNHEDSSHFQ